MDALQTTSYIFKSFLHYITQGYIERKKQVSFIITMNDYYSCIFMIKERLKDGITEKFFLDN